MLFFLPIKNFGQSKYNYKQGYKFIIKANKNLNKGNLNRTDKFLKKARQSNYGFCGNAWAGAFGLINIIQAQVFNERKEFDKSLIILDSIYGCSFGANCDARDSLKVLTLILKFGKTKVKESFEQVNEIRITNADSLNFYNRYSIYFPELDYIFYLEANEDNYIIENGRYIHKKKNSVEFLLEIKNRSCFNELK